MVCWGGGRTVGCGDALRTAMLGCMDGGKVRLAGDRTAERDRLLSGVGGVTVLLRVLEPSADVGE